MPPLKPRSSLFALALLGLGLTASAWGQDADLKIQGEYADAKSGVQVVAKGSGAFTAVIFTGGLPGNGWDGKTRSEQSGTLKDGAVSFAGLPGMTIAAAGDSLVMHLDVGDRTLPKVIRKSPTLDAKPPQGAVILFDGTDVSAWKDGTATLTSEKWLKPAGASASQGATTKASFGDFTLHLEFREPFMPTSAGQRRGNSGVYLQGRQELQVLDSFGTNLVYTGTPVAPATRECGAFFEYVPPALNMSLPPLTWQTYDVEYTAARYDASGKTQTSPTHVHVKLNGVVIHEDAVMTGPTLLGEAIGPAPGPLRFQAYGDDVVYRNIWLVESAGATARPFPARARARVASPRLYGLDGRLLRPGHVRLAATPRVSP